MALVARTLRGAGAQLRGLAARGAGARGFAAAGGGDHGGGGGGVTHGGLTLHRPARWHVATGKAFAGLMWFWIFYRFYHDGDHLLHGPAKHMEHLLHEEHGEGGGGGGKGHH